MLDRTTSRTALDLLDERLEGAVECGASSWMPAVWAPAEPTVIVGAGGSHPAAEFLARLLRDRGVVARAAYPLDAAGPERRMLAVTYSGRTPDIAEAIARFRAAGGTEVLVLTGQDSPACADDDMGVLCHRPDLPDVGWAEPERGFMSFASTVAPCAAALAAVSDLNEVRGALERAAVTGSLFEQARLFSVAASVHPVEVFATEWAWPAALDLESKWSEAGLGHLRLHETKDFSHGRYVGVLESDAEQPPLAVLLSAGPFDAYHDELAATLDRHTRLFTAHAPAAGPLGGLALLAATQHLVVDAGEWLDVDVSRPKIPADGLTLHHWKWTS